MNITIHISGLIQISGHFCFHLDQAVLIRKHCSILFEKYVTRGEV